MHIFLFLASIGSFFLAITEYRNPLTSNVWLLCSVFLFVGAAIVERLVIINKNLKTFFKSYNGRNETEQNSPLNEVDSADKE